MAVYSENKRLRRVIVHRPGRELSLLRPQNVREQSSDYLLMDDILHLPVAQAEHEIFCRVLSETAEVIFFTQLLTEVLAAKPELKGYVAGMAKLPFEVSDLPPEDLTTAVLTGEYDGKSYGVPCVNLLFARDIGAVVGKAIILSYAACFDGLKISRPREVEMSLMRLIARYHPLFRDYQVIDINQDRSRNFYSIEGGDVFPLTEKVVAIGVSQRTSVEAVKRAAGGIFNQGFERLLMVHIPKDRRSMHLDTIFSKPSADDCVYYQDAIESEELRIEMIGAEDPERCVALTGSFLSVMQSQLNQQFKAFACAKGDSLIAEREQWTDGTNLLALADGVVIAYDRNEVTNGFLAEQGGYQILQPENFIGNSETYLNGRKKAIVVIPSAELSRGRGGPRCMSFPIERN